jgi:hypothetical protein
MSFGLPAVARLLEELEDVNESFMTLPCRIDVANYHEVGEHPLVRLYPDLSVMGVEIRVLLRCR